MKMTQWTTKRNAAIALPGTLITEDGREIMVQEWSTTVSVDGRVTVQVNGIIRIPPLVDETSNCGQE